MLRFARNDGCDFCLGPTPQNDKGLRVRLAALLLRYVLPVRACARPGITASLRPDRVRRALDEGLQLRDVLLLQLAGEVGHALVAERALEHEVL